MQDKQAPNDSDNKIRSQPPAKNEFSREGAHMGKQGTMPLLAADKYAEVVLPELREWDVENIKLDATIVAVGKRRTGKSWAFRNIMFHMRDKIPAGIVISQTDPLNKFWQDYVPAKYIFPKYSPELLRAVFRRQTNILNDDSLTDAEKDKIAPFFILLDDVISDQRLKYDEEIMELFVAGRHYRLFVLITTQYAKAITPTLRGNTDYVLMLKNIQGRQREALYEDFGDFMTKDGFMALLDNYTEDNEMLVVDTSDPQLDPMEMMFWWKAQEIKPFPMGSAKYWDSRKDGKMLPPTEVDTIDSRRAHGRGPTWMPPPPWDLYCE